MDGLTLGLTLVGIIIGAVVSYLVSRHFFQKGVKKKTLTPYIQFASKLFSELDPELRENLIVNYKNVKVENIAQAQFLIANTGDIPIRDIIKPLRLTLPSNNKIFSVNIVHVEPEGREISYKIIETQSLNHIEFNIPLLNGGEFFIFKILIQDTLPQPDDTEDKERKSIYSFTVTADELPPHLEINRLPYSYYEQEKKEDYDWAFVWLGAISLQIFIAIMGTILSLKMQSKGLYLFAFSEFFNMETFGIYNICILSLSFFGLIAFILAIIGVVGAIAELTPDEKPKFRVPSKLRKEVRFTPFDFFG